MGLLTTKLEEAELRNRMLKAELRNRQLKEELAKREGRKPPEVIVLRYDPFPDEDPLEGITPAPSAAAEVIRPEAASEAWAGPWEGQEAVAGEMQPVEPGAPEIAPKVPLGASRDFREDLSIPAEERDEDYLRQQGKRIKDMGILPGQAAEQEITGKTQEGWGARLERGWAKAKEHSLFFKTWGTISKLIGGVEHKRYRGRTLDPDVLRGYEYETRKAELEADRQREEEKRLGTAAGQLRSLEQAEAGELVPEAPSTRTGQIPPAPGEKILPEYREGPSLEPDVSDIGVQEKYREPIPREAEVEIQKALDEIERLPWKEIEKVGSHVVADLWDLSPYLVGITTATGSLSRLMQMKQFKYLRGMKALDNYAREYRALSSTNQARLEVEAMQMYGAGVRETIEQKSLEAAAKYAEYGRKIRITERVMKSLPVQTQEFVLAEAAKNNRVPTWEDYRKAAEMVIMFKAGGMVYDKVKGWVKSATRNKKALVLGREPGGVPIATESYSQLPKGLPEPITMKSRPGEPPGPVQGEPAGTASPGGLLPAPKVTPKRAPEAQGDLFEQPAEGKPQPRPKALREIYDPIGQLGEDLKKDPGNKYIQELIDAISDPVFKGILPTGYFRKSIDKLRKQKIPFSFGYLDINNLGGANAFFEEKAGHEGADDILRKAYGDIFMAQLRKEGGFAGKGRRADEISYALPYSTPEELRAFMGKVSQQVSNLPEIKALSSLTHGKSGLPNAGALNFDFGVTEGEGTIQEITIRADQEMSVNRALRKEKLAQEQGLIYDKNRKAYVRREQFEETGVGSPDQPSGGPGTSVPKGREPRSEAAGQRVPERPASETPVEPQRGPTIPEEADLSQEDIDFIYDHLPPEKRPRPSGKIVEPLTPDEKLEAAQETYEKELEEYRRWEEWDTQFPHPYGKIARRMAQLIKKKGQVRPKGEKLQLSEHIPKKFFGIASDDLASIMREAGWSGESENDLMAILADYPDRVLKPKLPESVKEPAPGYSREQAQLDLAKKQEDMFAPQEEKAQRELKRIQAQRAQAAKARDKGTEGLPLFEGPAKDEAEQTSMFGDVVKEPGAQYDAETETINLKTIKLKKDSPLKPFEGRDIQVPAGLEQQLVKHKGTKWYEQTLMSLEYQAEIRDLISGREPKMGLVKRLMGGRMYSMLKKGKEGVWEYGRIAGVIGTPTKPGKAVNSSLINCEPSKACAKFCYVTTGMHYQYGTSRSKSELINYMAQTDPTRLGKMIADEYKASLEYETNKALRFFDKGDITPEWVKVIKATNDAGVRVHIFSRKPRLLKQVGPENVRLLSIDNTNMDIAKGNNLPIAFIYSGQADIPLLEKLQDRIQVILPVVLGKRVMSPEEVAKLPAWTKKHQCPIDNRTKSLPAVGTNTGWTCIKCDRAGGVGCYRNQPTNKFRASPVGRVTQKSAKELMKYAEENLTPEQYKRVLGQLRSIIKGIKERGETGISGSDVQVPGAVSEAPSSFKPAPGPVKAPSKAEQLDLFKQLKKDVKEIEPVPEAKLDPAIKKAREKVKPGWKAIFGDRGRIFLKGLTLKGEGIKKFIETIQVFRNPMYEVYRIIYLRDGVVLDYDSFSSQLPGQSLVHPVDPYERIKWYYKIQDRMKRLGANEVMQLHNHPAQNVDPSLDDRKVTEFFRGMFGKFYKGHIIINHRIGSILSSDGTALPFDITEGSPDPYEPGKKIKNADEMMDVAASINNQKDHIGLSFFNSQLKAVGISSLHVNDFLKNPKQFIATVHNMARDRGATAIVASPPSPGSTELDIPDDLAKQLYDLKVKGEWLFFDTVYPDEMATSQMKYGARGRLGYDLETMKFLRVREETPSYDIDPQEPSKYIRKWRDVKAEFQSNRKRVPAKVLPIYDRWVREVQTRTFKLARLTNQLKRMGSLTEREAVPFVIEKTKVPDGFNRPDLQKAMQDPESRKRIDAMVDLVKPHYEEMQDYMAKTLDTIPQEWIEDYVTHIWLLKNKKQRQDVASWFTTSNQFLKKRTIATIAEGITERGLTPKTLDIAELISIHGQVVIKTTENKVFLDAINALEEEGIPLIMPAHKAPKEWKIMDHPALLRYKYVGEGEKKIRVHGLNRTLLEYVEKIVTIERSGPSVAKSQSSPVQKLEKVVTDALETRGMTPGEANNYLERLKATYAGKGSEAAGGAESRKEESVRRFSQVVDEVEQKITVKYPRLEKRPIKYHPDLDPMMQAVFYKSWDPTGKLRLLVDAWEGINALQKQTRLSISFFHHIALGESAITITGPLRYMLVSLNLKAMWNSLMKNEFVMFQKKWEPALDGVEHGMILEANSDMQRGVVDRIFQRTGDFIETHAGKIIASPVRVLGWAKTKWDQLLWDYYHNNLKLYGYEYIVNKELGRIFKKANEIGIPPDKKLIKKKKEEIAAFMNDTFGGQNLLRQMSHPGFMRAFRAVMLSPDWLVSTIKQAIAMFGLAGVHPDQWPLRAKMGITMWIKAAIYFGGASILLNYLFTKQDDAEQRDVPFSDGEGKWMWENDPGHETHLFIGRDSEGGKIYARHGKQFRELPEFFYDAEAGEWSPITAAMKKLGGKVAPVPEIISSVATGYTPSGFPVRKLQNVQGWNRAWAITKHLSSSWFPFSFSSFLDERKEFHPLQFGLPTSKGMTQFKTRKLMKIALIQGDKKFLERIWTAAVDNNIPNVDVLFDQAVAEQMSDAQEEYQAELRKNGITDEGLEKIQNRGQVKAASEVIQRMIQQKKSIEKQKTLATMKRRIEAHLKRKQTMEEELSPKERDRFLDTLKSKRDKYELELKP